MIGKHGHCLLDRDMTRLNQLPGQSDNSARVTQSLAGTQAGKADGHFTHAQRPDLTFGLRDSPQSMKAGKACGQIEHIDGHTRLKQAHFAALANIHR